jgi:ribosome-associated protein
VTRDDDRSARQIARSQARRAGDDSARLARLVMKLGDAALARLELDDDLRDAIVRARAVTSPIARRRAERTLAGDLRRFDLAALDAQLAAADTTSSAEVRRLHQAEQWRAQLIEGGIAAAEAFPGGASDELVRLIHAAQRERDTGRPPGAAHALFRYIAAALT